MTTIREAAVELKGHAWLDRFRKADGVSNNYDKLSPTACNDIARYADKFIDAVLAEYPADDGEAVTVGWLVELGFRHHEPSDCYEKQRFIYSDVEHSEEPDDWTTLAIQPDGWYPCRYTDEEDDTVQLPMPKNRGEFRRLCAALGIPLKP